MFITSAETARTPWGSGTVACGRISGAIFGYLSTGWMAEWLRQLTGLQRPESPGAGSIPALALSFAPTPDVYYIS